MANKVVNGKPGAQGTMFLYDEQGRYVGKSRANAAGNLIYTDEHGNYKGRCKAGPGHHVILVPDGSAKENSRAGSRRSTPAGPPAASGYLGFAVLSLVFLILGGLSAACLYYDLRWGLDVGFLEVAGVLLGVLTLAADLLILADFCKKKRLRKKNNSSEDPSS